MPSQLLNLFTTQPAELLYFVWVIVFSQAALLMSIGQRLRGKTERGAGRYLIASLAVMACWVVLMIAAWIVVITGNSDTTILPPLNHVVNLMVVLVIGWAFLTADLLATRQGAASARVFSVGVGLVALIIVGAYAYTAVQWFHAGSGFNAHSYDLAWEIGALALTAFGFILFILRFRSTVDAPLKMIFFAVMLAAYGYALYAVIATPGTSDDTGIMRLAFLIAIPVLPVIVYRLVINRLSMIINERSAQMRQAVLAAQNVPQPIIIEPGAEREAMNVLKVLGMMLASEAPKDLPRQIVMATADALKADITALLSLDDPEYADVIAAYDNIRQQSIAAMAIKLDEQPTLREAIVTASQRSLVGDQHLNEMVDLYTRLDIQKLGAVYFQPLNRDGVAVGVLVVALPYTQRDLRESEIQLLSAIGPIAARLVNISRAAQRSRSERDAHPVQAVLDSALPISSARAEMQSSLELARDQINELSSRVRDLQIELDFERGRLAELGANDSEGLSVTQRLNRLTSERTALESEREKLMQALKEASTQLATVSGDDEEVYATVIKALQRERDELQVQKAQLELQLGDIRAAGQTPAPAVLRDVLTKLSDDKARLALERDQIKEQLGEVETQLRALGIEGGPAALTTMIVQLTEERSHYKAVSEKAIQDRETLLNERERLSDQIATEEQRDTQIAATQIELRRLAEDNEVLRRQRDGLRQERDTYGSDRERWEGLRARMVADLGAIQSDMEEAIFERNQIRTQSEKLAQQRAEVLSERDQWIAERTALQTERGQLMARIQGNRDTLQQLGADGVGALKKMIDDLTEERSDLEYRIVQLENKAKALQEALGKANAQIANSVLLPSSVSVDASDAEVMLSIAQELRTPMSSMAGYADLLLSESVGILGASQRQFLQRIKANSDRAQALIEDFIRVTRIDTGQFKLKPQEVDMIEIIDDSITATRTQFREKGITLKMDIPRSLPPLQGDCDALQQIVIQLLSNAYLASKTDGEVMISAKFEPDHKFPTTNGKPEHRADVIFLSVRDMGGGVPPEEQSRVFSRLYRADNPTIQGVGDTGVGLSIARALTEAHDGRIWLESVPDVSSTFKLIIPLSTEKT